jgi:hypothetical protein
VAPSAWSWLGLEYHSFYGAAFGITNPMHIAQKFEKLLDAYWHPDGSQWTGQQIDEAPTDWLPALTSRTSKRAA